ncbi:uncharacterized protein LOC123007737 [Tribolium madens]|uniref:uncharacterized protein LOC123007737 n=1 Tax=Tribolium madens TaxID=41895 RepID=UPI001CF76306|nr:uncharacterized protein LOC123007737 [Tribolium madens]
MHTSARFYTIFLWLTLTQAKLQVSLYYETLCPDSMRFITTQLHPSYQNFEKYLTLDLVPFGKARVKKSGKKPQIQVKFQASNSSGHWHFQCQHGPRECHYNKIHSCVVALYPQEPALDFINCAMTPPNSPQTCASETGISWNAIADCLEHQADELLAENGAKTDAVTPPISYVPTIIFDGIYDKAMQDFAENNFAKCVCFLLKNRPAICKKLTTLYNIIMYLVTGDPIGGLIPKMKLNFFLITLIKISHSLKVSLYYESLCYDSSRFITLQLTPNYSQLKNHIQLEFIPYGKATHNYVKNRWIFDCQHGVNECQGNKYQACALAQNNGQDKNLAFVDCVMRDRNPADVTRMKKCAQRVGIDWGKISNCATTSQGDDLLAKHGVKTYDLEPNISFVPTVVYDDKFDDNLQEMSLVDFAAVVCSKIRGDKPRICDNKMLPQRRRLSDYFF